MTESAALLDRLREHIYGGAGCSTCDPEYGVYCAQIARVVERFYEARRDEVLAARLAARLEPTGCV